MIGQTLTVDGETGTVARYGIDPDGTERVALEIKLPGGGVAFMGVRRRPGGEWETIRKHVNRYVQIHPAPPPTR